MFDQPFGKIVVERHANLVADDRQHQEGESRDARQRHSGVEAAIGAIQRGNGLKRCRDRSELGFERYFGLAVLGRNIHTLGKSLIAQRNPLAASAKSKRKAA